MKSYTVQNKKILLRLLADVGYKVSSLLNAQEMWLINVVLFGWPTVAAGEKYLKWGCAIFSQF